MPPGTGLWLNNCLGELELNRDGLDAGPPGRRLPSNMAPGCARSASAVLAMGSPGADRITTALHQFLSDLLAAEQTMGFFPFLEPQDEVVAKIRDLERLLQN